MLKFGAILLLCACASSLPVQSPRFKLPEKYTFEGVFSIPTYGIREELTVFTDSTTDRQLVSYYNGRDVYVTRGDLGMSYEIVPRINETVCFTTNTSGGPTEGLFAAAPVPLAPYIPDISSWEEAGEEKIRGVECLVYETKVQNFTTTNTYRFAVSKSDAFPMQLKMHGINFIHQSHPDLYIMDYNVFSPTVDEAVFDVPALCNKTVHASPAPAVVAARVRANLHRTASIIPPRHNACEESHEFKGFRLFHGKHYATCEEHAHRQNVWLKNIELIFNHNARNLSHTLAPNKFADMTDEEFRSLMLMRKGGRAANNRAHRTHVADANAIVPKHVDWRKKGGVTPVKDQAACGSCWSFGSAASLEGVNFVKNGKLVSVSEQQIVDCAWGFAWSGPGGNLGCDGGYASAAFQWMIDNGGVAAEHGYAYSGQDGWCAAHDHSANIKVTAYVNVSSSDDLKHAIATIGTVAVAIDASHPSFRFYSKGVYYEPECKSGINDLDHEVAAVGYGVTHHGEEYWILKNSWSAHGWGDEGFVKMSMKDNNCGTATQATYPIVE